MISDMDPSRRRQVIDALHPSRMKPYLDAVQGNEKKALTLYEWHCDLTTAVQTVLGITEVVLRNAMDRELQEWNKIQTGTDDSWLLSEPASPLRSLTARKRKEALERAFPNVDDPEGETTFWRVSHVHHLRNRVSHMEPIFNIDVKDQVGDAFSLVRSINVDVAQWLTGISRVSAILKTRP